jgi:TetR/AcrR family transcriptional regulator, repressor of fatR-cypB operon
MASTTKIPSQPASRSSQRSIPAAAATDKAERREAAATDKRDAIMAAALSLFVERGFYGTAVPEIADRASVGAGTIYRYFESKEALVNELYRQEKQGFAKAVIENFSPPAGGRELFRVLWGRMARYATDHTKSFVFLELHHHARYLDAESVALEQRMLALFEGVIVSQQVRGELKKTSPRLLMALVMGAFVGVIRNCVEMSEPLTEAAWLTAEQCMWEAIRA